MRSITNIVSASGGGILLFKTMDTTELIPIETINRRIFTIRGVKVMLDSDLAELYGIRTMRLNQAVKRNFDRFPDDFMFRLSREEAKELNLSQNVIGSRNGFDRGKPQFTTGWEASANKSRFGTGSKNSPGHERPKFVTGSGEYEYSNLSQNVIGSGNGFDPDKPEFIVGSNEYEYSNLSQNVIGPQNGLDPDRTQFATDPENRFDRDQSQFVNGLQRHRNPRFLPYAFTEHGVAMLSTVLRSERASEMSVYIVRAFIVSSTANWTN